MSYTRGFSGLGGLTTGASYVPGQQFVGGFLVQANGTAEQKLQALRTAAASFPGTIVGSGWGGPTAPGGVPAGSLWVTVRASGALTGEAVNQAFARMGAQIQALLSGSRVTNTHAWTYGSPPSSPSASSSPGASSGANAGAAATSAVTGLLTSLFPAPATTPATIPSAMPGAQPYYDGSAEPTFLTQTVGGVPMWGVLAGGTLAVGALAFFALKPKRTVTPNRRRRGSRRRSSMRMNAVNYPCPSCGKADLGKRGHGPGCKIKAQETTFSIPKRKKRRVSRNASRRSPQEVADALGQKAVWLTKRARTVRQHHAAEAAHDRAAFAEKAVSGGGKKRTDWASFHRELAQAHAKASERARTLPGTLEDIKRFGI